jgi:hypothetical protein
VKGVDNAAIQAQRDGDSVDSVMENGNRKTGDKVLHSASPVIGNPPGKWRRQAHPDLTETRRGCHIFVKTGQTSGLFLLF